MIDGPLGALRAVLESELSSKEKLVLIAILNHWSKASPQPFPSADTLARLTSYDERSIRRTIKSLAEKGAMKVIPTAGRPNRFDLTPVFDGALPRTESHPHPGQAVTPDSVSPLSESRGHPCHAVTPPLTGSPGTPDRLPPEVVKEVTNEVTQVKEPRERRVRAPRSKAASQRFCPEGWEPNQQHRAQAEQLRSYVDFDLELQKFRNHEFKRAITDWSRAFTKWLVNAFEYGKQAGNVRNGAPKRAPAPVSTTYETSDDFGGLT